MFYKSFLKCAIVLTLSHHKIVQCDLNSNNSQTPLIDSVVETSSIISKGEKLINEENVTFIDKSYSLDINRDDKSHNNREFPPSARHKRNLDTPYQDIDYNYDYKISPATSPELSECILSRSEFYLSWWVNEDGSLRLPPSNRSGSSSGFVDLSIKIHSNGTIFKHVSDLTTKHPNDVIIFMSIANNELNRLPVETLNLVSISLQYLSLANNQFDSLFNDHNETFQTWSAFPLMNSLKELDLRNCSLIKLDRDIFDNLPSLEKLFLSHNFLAEIESKTFLSLVRLTHLDLSYNTMDEGTSYIVDPFSFFLSGLMLEEDLFGNLTNLIFLDLSHTKLKQESVRALSALRDKVEQLSLCFTDIPLIIPRMFSGTNLKVLDLSGNPSLIPNLLSSWFSGLEQKLEILIFENSNIKNIGPFRNLKKLRMLSLENNNINQVVASHFINFADLEILDLKGNHISNWYERVFEKNNRLKIVNLRNNNINLMTAEMMFDFSLIKFLAIGANNFVCDCSLREFIDRASFNARFHQCGIRRTRRAALHEEFYDPKYHYEVFLREYHGYVRFIEESSKNIADVNREADSYTSKYLQKDSAHVETVQVNCDELVTESERGDAIMTFDFLLLDYSENDYHCIESDGSLKSKVSFVDIAKCPAGNSRSAEDSTAPNSSDEDSSEDEHYGIPSGSNTKSPKTLLILYISIGIPLTFVGAIWFWKRRDIKYFCAIFKNTLILSFDKSDKQTLMMKNRKSNNNEDDYRFDLFVSYSDKDREFVLDQLIPNLEKRSEITICLHERDFQVGLSILENIIQCMDQSRCLLLVISESFIKSNWCSFEMHLAQHRLIETRREQLILVLLQDIPKAKRPRTLSFLMRTKTYIMWPSEDKEELRNVFWRRLKKAIVLNNWEPERSKPKPRHSIV